MQGALARPTRCAVCAQHAAPTPSSRRDAGARAQCLTRQSTDTGCMYPVSAAAWLKSHRRYQCSGESQGRALRLRRLHIAFRQQRDTRLKPQWLQMLNLLLQHTSLSLWFQPAGTAIRSMPRQTSNRGRHSTVDLTTRLNKLTKVDVVFRTHLKPRWLETGPPWPHYLLPTVELQSASSVYDVAKVLAKQQRAASSVNKMLGSPLVWRKRACRSCPETQQACSSCGLSAQLPTGTEGSEACECIHAAQDAKFSEALGHRCRGARAAAICWSLLSHPTPPLSENSNCRLCQRHCRGTACRPFPTALHGEQSSVCARTRGLAHT